MPNEFEALNEVLTSMKKEFDAYKKETEFIMQENVNLKKQFEDTSAALTKEQSRVSLYENALLAMPTTSKPLETETPKPEDFAKSGFVENFLLNNLDKGE